MFYLRRLCISAHRFYYSILHLLEGWLEGGQTLIAFIYIFCPMVGLMVDYSQSYSSSLSKCPGRSKNTDVNQMAVRISAFEFDLEVPHFE